MGDSPAESHRAACQDSALRNKVHCHAARLSDAFFLSHHFSYNFRFFFFGSEREKNSRQDFGKLPSWQRPITHSTDKHHHHGTVAQVYKKSR